MLIISKRIVKFPQAQKPLSVGEEATVMKNHVNSARNGIAPRGYGERENATAFCTESIVKHAENRS